MACLIILGIDTMNTPRTHRLTLTDMLRGETTVLPQDNTHRKEQHRGRHQNQYPYKMLHSPTIQATKLRKLLHIRKYMTHFYKKSTRVLAHVR